MSDNRKETRLGIKLEVELRTEEQELSLKTRDLSNSGVFLTADDSALPTEGSIVELKIKQAMGDSDPPVTALTSCGTGLGIKPFNPNAVISASACRKSATVFPAGRRRWRSRCDGSPCIDHPAGRHQPYRC